MLWILLLAAYLIGSVPTALVVGKLAFNIDIRDHGSHNPGATNTLRVLGKKAAIVVLIVDVGKGILASSLPIITGYDIEPLYLGLVAIVGHCFPIFADFRGGKAIATTAGVLIFVNFWMSLFVFTSFFLVIFLTKYVFLGSISVGLALICYSLFITGDSHGMLFLLFSLFLIFLHRSNIRNFILQVEPKINDKNLKNDRIPPKGNTIGR